MDAYPCLPCTTALLRASVRPCVRASVRPCVRACAGLREPPSHPFSEGPFLNKPDDISILRTLSARYQQTTPLPSYYESINIMSSPFSCVVHSIRSCLPEVL